MQPELCVSEMNEHDAVFHNLYKNKLVVIHTNEGLVHANVMSNVHGR